MSAQTSSLVQAVLEGVDLPATRRELIDYARRQRDGGTAASALERIPDREYESLDDVGEALAPAQPDRSSPQASAPREESGLPPGGDAYTNAEAEPGAVRPDGPG